MGEHRQLEQHFAAALRQPDTAPPSGLVNPDGSPARKRFDVYRNNVAQSLSEALALAFPAVQSLVGTEFFAALALEHIRAFPPRSPVMMQYGADFPQFLADFPPLAHLPYLPDIARLELLRRAAYHAADAQPADPACLGRCAPDQLGAVRLHPHPSLRVITSDYPLLGIWEVAMGEASAPGEGPCEALIVRPDDRLAMVALPKGGAAFVQALATHPLGAAAGDGFDPGPTLALLFTHRAIAQIDLPVSKSPKGFAP